MSDVFLDYFIELADPTFFKPGNIQALIEKNRDAARFMWSNGNIEDERMITYRFKRVLFGENASPFQLSATIKKYIEQFHSGHPTSTSLLDFCLYVDNLIAGEDSVQDALEVSYAKS
ncbi:hypothetical protein NPIL_447731 [Nephila pilipes]|uniref:Uncharacterized protein n=1 Tax=Nephila pilipes TaxID=299642 RepID=A0A8X6N6F6_NEPPI|nr:hypothetical protein NPIL_447731 [Nephila pilipes]